MSAPSQSFFSLERKEGSSWAWGCWEGMWYLFTLLAFSTASSSKASHWAACVCDLSAARRVLSSWAPFSGDHQAGVGEDCFYYFSVFQLYWDIIIYLWPIQNGNTESSESCFWERAVGGQGTEFCLDPMALAQWSCWGCNCSEKVCCHWKW